MIKTAQFLTLIVWFGKLLRAVIYLGKQEKTLFLSCLSLALIFLSCSRKQLAVPQHGLTTRFVDSWISKASYSVEAPVDKSSRHKSCNAFHSQRFLFVFLELWLIVAHKIAGLGFSPKIQWQNLKCFSLSVSIICRRSSIHKNCFVTELVLCGYTPIEAPGIHLEPADQQSYRRLL